MAVQGRNRRFLSYVIGTGKTGTQSMAGIFAQNFRSAHEPASRELISLALDVAAGVTSRAAVRDLLVARDNRLSLELESDGTLWQFLPELIDLFPQGKFILTIRDCYTWLNSVFDHNVKVEAEGPWRRYDDLTYASWHYEYEPEEEILATHGLRTLSHYLSHWTAHNEAVIRATPRERLLVVRTDQIRQMIPAIEIFIGIPEGTLDPQRAHLHKTPRKLNLLSRIDPAFVREKVDTHCGALMQEYFPEANKLGRSAGPLT